MALVDQHRVMMIVGLVAAGLLALATLAGGGDGADRPAPAPVTHSR